MIATLLAVGLTLGMGLSMGAVAAQPDTVTECGTIDSPGEYVLEDDIGGDVETCIEITSDDVTFDGQGNSIEGVGDENSTGISVESGFEAVADVTLTDVEVSDWGEGISLAFVEDSTVNDVEVTGSEEGAVNLVDSSNNVVENSRLADNVDGVSVVGFFGEASDNEVRNNVIEDNEENGVVLFFGVSDSTVESNEVRDNDGAGILAVFGPSDSLVTDNTVTGNEVGYIAGLTEDNTVSENEFSENSVGVATTASFGETFSDNKVSGGDIGVLLADSAENAVLDNELKDNEIDYVDVSGTVDEEEDDEVLNVADAGIDAADTGVETAQDDEIPAGPNFAEGMVLGPQDDETVLSFESNNVSVSGVDPAEAPAPPEGQTDTGLYFEATDEIDAEMFEEELEDELDEEIEAETFTNSYLDVDVHYDGADFAGDEEDLALWKYDDDTGDWSEVPSTVDTQNEVVSANLTEYSTFGVFAGDADPVGPSVTATGDAVSPGGQATVNIVAENMGSVRLDGIPNDWSVSSSQNDGAFITPDALGDNIEEDGRVLWAWQEDRQSADVSVTLDVPEDAEETEYVLEAEVENNAGETATDTATVVVGDDIDVVDNYRNDEGRVDTAGLQDAISDFLADDIDTGDLQEVIQAFIADGV